MGYLWDYLTGGNIKVASSSLAGLHFFTSCDYLQTYIIRLNSIMQATLSKNNWKTFFTISLVENNEIRNYVDLVVLDLNISAAPENIGYNETYNSFSNEIAGYLVKKGIERKYIYGDNRKLTEDYINSLK